MREEEKKEIEPVPYFIHEGVVSRLSECNKKLLIALIVAVSAMFLNNIVWTMTNANNYMISFCNQQYRY